MNNNKRISDLILTNNVRLGVHRSNFPLVKEDLLHPTLEL